MDSGKEIIRGCRKNEGTEKQRGTPPNWDGDIMMLQRGWLSPSLVHWLWSDSWSNFGCWEFPPPSPWEKGMTQMRMTPIWGASPPPLPRSSSSWAHTVRTQISLLIT